LYYFENRIDQSPKLDYFSSFFSSFRDASLQELKYREFPCGNSHSEIQLFVKRKSPNTSLHRQFAWITAAGLFYTEIDPLNVEKSFLERNRIIDYYIDKNLKQRDEEKPPKSVALTEFHCLMMFPNENQIRGVCTVNEKIVMIDGSMSVSFNLKKMFLFFSKENDVNNFRVVHRCVMLEIKCVINYGQLLRNVFFVIQLKMNVEMFGVYLCKKKIFKKHLILVL
jgi:hypothetical protein